MLAEHRVIVEGTVERGLGDLAQEASLSGAGAGQSVEVRVRQCGEGEDIGWRKVCAQRCRCPANVVDNRGHEGFSFLLRAPARRLRGGRHQLSILLKGSMLCTIFKCPQGCRLGL